MLIHSPVTRGHLSLTLFSLYLLDRMSSIRISYGVSSYSIGVLVYSVFFSLTPLLSSWITCTHSLAQSWMLSCPSSLSSSTSDLLPETFSMKVVSSMASLTRALHTARKCESASEGRARWCLQYYHISVVSTPGMWTVEGGGRCVCE